MGFNDRQLLDMLVEAKASIIRLKNQNRKLQERIIEYENERRNKDAKIQAKHA